MFRIKLFVLDLSSGGSPSNSDKLFKKILQIRLPRLRLVRIGVPEVQYGISESNQILLKS